MKETEITAAFRRLRCHTNDTHQPQGGAIRRGEIRWQNYRVCMVRYASLMTKRLAESSAVKINTESRVYFPSFSELSY